MVEALAPTHDLVFHTDWFSHNIPEWEKFLAHLKGKPYLNALEIGSWEGRSACWLLQNVLTDPTCRLTCIDSFQGNPENVVGGYESDVEDTLRANIAAVGATDRVEILRMQSIHALRHMNLHDDSFDFAYIDGSHIMKDVLTDLVLAWPLMKHGSIIIMDDYKYCRKDMDAIPKLVIDVFQAFYRKEIIELHRGGQMIWRKI